MAQFPFVGQSYHAPMPLQDRQRCVNWYVEVSQDPMKQSKTPVALLGCPGLLALLTLGSGPLRGFWPLPGDTKAIAVSGDAVFMVSAPPANGGFSAAQIGTLATAQGSVCIRDNASGGIAVIVDGPNGYVVNIAARTVKHITDPAWMGADRVAFIDGWFVFNKPGTQVFYTSPLYWNGTDAMDATYYALKDSSSDNLVTMYEDRRELWLIGERTTEVWYDAGESDGMPVFPFARIQGVTPQQGCSATHSIVRVGDSMVWLGRNERGQNVVMRNMGYQVEVISHIGVNRAIASYDRVDDALAFAYQEDGHTFYVLTFPTADATWVWDETINMWHERASYDPLAGRFHRHRANCFMNFANTRIVGDYQNGKMYAYSRSTYTDDGEPLVAWRRTPHAWDQKDRERLFHSQLQIEFAPGVGLPSGQGSDPQAVLRWSDDGGATWSNEHWRAVGRIGQTKNRAIWRRLGASRDRVYDVKFSDPVCRDVVGASLMVD